MSGEGEINKCFTGELQTEELQKTCLASVMRSKTEKERRSRIHSILFPNVCTFAVLWKEVNP